MVLAVPVASLYVIAIIYFTAITAFFVSENASEIFQKVPKQLSRGNSWAKQSVFLFETREDGKNYPATEITRLKLIWLLLSAYVVLWLTGIFLISLFFKYTIKLFKYRKFIVGIQSASPYK